MPLGKYNFSNILIILQYIIACKEIL